ncbi:MULTISPECIES: flagellar hook assembly protein FlgD [unclassified Methylophaga]|jgi:flagellar basal-body rod modification protein FlgD|uniref:flagellar hook assembly protein FlgD n=1 Tax=unclassified Methylophaga TaxID=2629249 RepID=UPI000C9642B4|nr:MULTISPECIES: flagellar hook assembly protein FlgD [unclassified Methylophaga]MAP26638.1 flagellar hook capping protein [Methylophaga sp.]HBX59769.1 flagellar hook capping protein [Methylophaga sp.]HCN99797.1 flagellar hook capping protein [Methylophaga sp.]|tara:strand:- start:75 stop:758 length:684 start_codon:yes stop_codon:yes gene_type:complete
MAINGVSDNPYAFLNSKSTTSTTEEKNDPGKLQMEDFMSLMTTQLMNQDPLKPMESGDFLGQIASFSTVSGISDLQDSFGSFAKAMQSDQALQGSSLVGRSVLVPSSIGVMTADAPMRGQINVADPVSNLELKIYNDTGELVRTIPMGAASGYTNFEWDGLNNEGEAMPEGAYQFMATGSVDGQNTAFATAVIAKVDSVLVGSGGQGLTMNLAGIGSVPFSEVQEII